MKDETKKENKKKEIIELEKNDRLAMIIAALSVMLPVVLVFFGIIILVLIFIF